MNTLKKKIGGATGTGKTNLSIKIANILNGELINADSIQVYKELTIGANKERTNPPTRLIDLISVKDTHIGSGDFAQMTIKEIETLHLQNKVPIIVGGSGFFIQNILNGPPPTPKVEPNDRTDLEELKRLGTWDELIGKLAEIDPETANNIQKNDYVRLGRAFDIVKRTGKPLEKFNVNKKPEELKFDFRGFMLFMDRILLFQKLEKRCEEMIEFGLFEETYELYNLGIRSNSSFGIGYSLALEILEKKEKINSIVFDTFLEKFKCQTRNLVRTQLIWARKHNKNWKWLSVTDNNLIEKLQSYYDMNQNDFLKEVSSEQNQKDLESTYDIPSFKYWADKINCKYIYKDKKTQEKRIQCINQIIEKIKN